MQLNPRMSSFTAALKLRRFRMEPCVGAGYPDQRLHRIGTKRRFALEFKATRRFRPASTSRIVLTSASRKIRRAFRGPVSHLLVTI